MKHSLYIFILLNSVLSFSQKKVQDSLPKSLDEYIFVKVGDTLTVQLDEFVILPKHQFSSQEDARYYYWFTRKVMKAYPYAVLASERLDTLNARLSRIKSKRKRTQYMKRIQNYLDGEFSEEIEKMTHTEGRILIKLIHRQTGITVFNHIKYLKSGWKAFWYNTTAVVFKLSLKVEYSPEVHNEDYLIEDVLQRAFMDQRLEAQASKVKFDFQKIAASKKGNINVEFYKEMFAKQRESRSVKKIKNKNK